ncbi:major facilitator superfamily domain-containing protein [Lophiotrema nucula]|uniref:Major facilitator superfamily domain-containing protein n=1 Tax=Lophiotrema nucula TaxID=690887 RepID=A0A6A5ZDQ7_9PLEO|nr:major facilitator superfamily domain-containing protein [Lophiotrema nucula]
MGENLQLSKPLRPLAVLGVYLHSNRRNLEVSAQPSISRASISWFEDLEDVRRYPPQDTGASAWIFLFGASLVDAICWSQTRCFGVFREYYFTHPPFQGNSVIAVVGMLSDGCLQVLTPFLLHYLNSRLRHCKKSMILGLLLCILASLGAAFSAKTWQLLATQGVLYGIGGGCLTAGTYVFMAEWFDKRQTFAYGMVMSSSGIFGSFLPIVYIKALESYGQKITLIAHGIVVLILGCIALSCIRYRITPTKTTPKTSHNTTNTSNVNNRYSFIRRTSFYLLGLAVLIQAIVVSPPATYLPSFATDLGYSAMEGALAMGMFSLATAVGQIGGGIITDLRRSFDLTTLLSTTLSALAALLLWPEAKTIVAIIIFGSLYGLVSGSFSPQRPRFAAAVIMGDAFTRPPPSTSGSSDPSHGTPSMDPPPSRTDEDKEKILLVMGIYTATRGVGQVIGGFIGTALVNDNAKVDEGAYGLKKWTPLIIFVGGGMVLACAAGVANSVLVSVRKRRIVNEIR